MTPISDNELHALMKEAEPCGHLPHFGIRRDVLSRLLAELVIRREADEPARKLLIRDDTQFTGLHFNQHLISRRAEEGTAWAGVFEAAENRRSAL